MYASLRLLCLWVALGRSCGLQSLLTKNIHQVSLSSSATISTNPVRLGTCRLLLNTQEPDSSGSSIQGFSKYFIPGFIGIWAGGYSIIGYIETSGGGLGDSGGFIGAGLCVFLLLSLVGAAAYEVFKTPE